nr:hypothetical protein [Tanacetum cinerariifolium]
MEALKEEAMVVKPVSKKRKPEGLRRTNMRGCVPPLPTTTPKGAGKHPRVLARYIRNLASSSNSLALDVKEAYAAHNTLYNLHYPLLKEKLGFLTFDVLVNVFDVHALRMAVFGNMLTNESRIISRDHTKLEDDFVYLKSMNRLLKHEISKLEDILSKARKNQDVEGSQIIIELRSENA